MRAWKNRTALFQQQDFGVDFFLLILIRLFHQSSNSSVNSTSHAIEGIYHPWNTRVNHCALRGCRRDGQSRSAVEVHCGTAALGCGCAKVDTAGMPMQIKADVPHRYENKNFW